MLVDILDSVTLQRLQSLEFSREIPPHPAALVFSPDSRMLTSFTHNDHKDQYGFVVSWDLETGGIVSVIERKEHPDTKIGNVHITYSMNGKVVAVLLQYTSSTTISIYNVVSGAYTHDVDHSLHKNPALGLEAPCVYKIWTHEGSLRFATPEPTGIIIWEVGFAPGDTPTEVETVSIPDKTLETVVFNPEGQNNFAPDGFHPASSRLASIDTGGKVLIWDGRASKSLLHHQGVYSDASMNFSPDGRFFACTTVQSEVYLWKESPIGYELLGQLSPGTRHSKPHFSPDGESIITFSSETILLWHTKNLTTATSLVLPQTPRHIDEDFILEFLSDRQLVVATRKKDKTVTVLNLGSGVPQLIIDTSVEVYGLRSNGNTIAVIGDEKAITWDLPEIDPTPNARMNVEDSIRTIHFSTVDNGTVVGASISLDFRYIILIRESDAELNVLDIHCPSTGRNFRVEVRGQVPWSGQGEHDVWCADDDGAEVYTITQDTLNQTKTAADIEDGSWGCPWGSSRGCKVTHDGWVLGADGKRLLMLPPLWHSRSKVHRVWSGRFLALLHGALPELVILELEL